MTIIKIKRVYEKESEGDGFRVFVDRLWPRGIKKEDLHFDLWEKAITPSPGLRSWYHEDTQGHWKEFVKKYRKELEQSDAIDGFMSKISGHKTITLLYAAKDENRNYALVLKDFLETLLSRT